MNTPHAWAVETLWNQGTRNEKWARAMDMDDVTEPLSYRGAMGLREEMIADGHHADTVRVVAMIVVSVDDDEEQCPVRYIKQRLTDPVQDERMQCALPASHTEDGSWHTNASGNLSWEDGAEVDLETLIGQGLPG